MNGITNAQQGGGGGGAASITYTKLAGGVYFESSYQSASNAFFVKADVATWPTLGEDEPKALTSTSDLGLIVGSSYEIYVNIDGTEKSFSGTAADGASQLGVSGSKTLMLDDGEQGFVIYDHCDFSQGYPQKGNGSIIMARLSSSPTSAKITRFTGTLITVSPATITNSAIKINSAVTMYINSDIILEGTKTDGSIALSASDGGSVDYEMEIIDTATEGLFVVVNSYIPTIPDVPEGTTDYDELENVPVINQDLSATGFTPVKDTYYRHTGTTNSDYTKGVIYKCVDVGSTSNPLEMFEIASMYDVYTTLNEGVAPLLPHEKDITNASTNVSITGSVSPYLFTVTDSGVSSYKFVRLYPMDEDTETWLNEHTLSSIITEDRGKFTFKVDTNTLPTAFSIKYIIESFVE
nr:MAG TPA: hypothetical protein [Caudoviricetes sp.]